MTLILDADDMAEVAGLFREYAAYLGVAEVLPDFEHELASLPGDYVAPGGALLVARQGEVALGCIALKPLALGVGEVKRLYLRPEGRGQGIGKALVAAILERARQAGYREVMLDTMAHLVEAQALYRGFGFEPVASFRDSPYPHIRYYGRVL
jgi:GNAT superfamily N-acetyltransferase